MTLMEGDMERRYHSPYKHWVTGLFTELGVLSGFVAFLILLAFVVYWVFG